MFAAISLRLISPKKMAASSATVDVQESVFSAPELRAASIKTSATAAYVRELAFASEAVPTESAARTVVPLRTVSFENEHLRGAHREQCIAKNGVKYMERSCPGHDGGACVNTKEIDGSLLAPLVECLTEGEYQHLRSTGVYLCPPQLCVLCSRLKQTTEATLCRINQSPVSPLQEFRNTVSYPEHPDPEGYPPHVMYNVSGDLSGEPFVSYDPKLLECVHDPATGNFVIVQHFEEQVIYRLQKAVGLFHQ
jgi:hypothetical protein